MMGSSSLVPDYSLTHLQAKQCTLLKLVTKSLLLFLLLCQFSPINAQVPKLFPYGLDHMDSNLPRDVDDVSAPELRLQTPISFYGQIYPSVYINQNGIVSFLTDIPAFVNMQFPLDYPTIAPLYQDVDTRLSGTVYYRETQSEELLERARTMFSDHFSSAVNFQPLSLLICTWDDVGYYERKSDKTNTYQLVIGSDGVESYVVFLYDKIGWNQGTGKNPSLPDAKGQSGFISGHGPHHSVPGSGTDQVSNLHKRSNANEEGVWMYRVGRVGEKLEEPDLNVILESSSESSSSCAAGGVTSCHSQASCVDYNPGFCCQCARNFYGNGRVCLPNDIPVRMTGKVKGVFNGVALDDSDLFSYIVPQDGRAYTAVAKIPERLGYDLQTVITLGTSIGWLFSLPVKGTPNGFQLTGGELNYTSDINFSQTGQKVHLQQSFTGLDVFSQMMVDTRIHGSAPIVPVNKTIEVNDVKMDFTRVSPGLIRSRSSHSYVVEGTSQENPFTIEQTIEYKECPWASPVPPELDTITMKVGRNYIVYDAKQMIARFAITSKVTPVEGEDPCKENKDKCGPNSSCVVENDNYRCICNLGYEQRYIYEEEEGEEGAAGRRSEECEDVNECSIGTSTCDVTAVCHNSPGSYSCQCQPGYVGDGFSCQKVLSCIDVHCSAYASCLELSPGNPECRCNPGFAGDGLLCYESTGVEVGAGSPLDCRQVRNLCDPFAECIYSSSSRSYVCSCTEGYTGNGMTCHREAPADEESCDIVNNCHPYADCRLDENRNEYTCVCQSGFFGDGYSCIAQNYGQGYESSERPPDPICVLGECYCTSGYNYDEERGECKYGHVISTSTEQAECNQDPSICDPNASCLYENGKYRCVCNHGYTLADNGVTCQEDVLGCNVLQNCGKNAECQYDPQARSYRCSCVGGFEGDGFRCRSTVPCYQDRSICDVNAECKPDGFTRVWKCQCVQGFYGDGEECKPASTNANVEGDQLIVAKGMSLIKINLGNGKPLPLTVEPFQTAIGIDIDCLQQKVYWSDVATRAIKMGNINGSGKGIFLEDDIGSPEGLAIDWASGNIYWTDSEKGAQKIAVANLKTKVRQTVISSGLVNPRGIAVYPQRGRLFWSDWNREYPKIEFSGLDGQERQVLVGEGLALPNSLVVDQIGNQLCWADAGKHLIECVGIDGRNRRPYVTKVQYPFGLTLGPENFYWTDWDTKQVESASRQTGEASKSYEVSLGGPGKLYGLVFVPSVCPQVYSPCEYNPCGEERICLPNSRGGRSCICGDNAPHNCQNLL